MLPLLSPLEVGGVCLALGGLLSGLSYGVYKCLSQQRDYQYTPVAHTLDEEEQEFKRTLERQGDDIDDLFLFEGEQELEFSAEEIEQLGMLDGYRSSERGPGKGGQEEHKEPSPPPMDEMASGSRGKGLTDGAALGDETAKGDLEAGVAQTAKEVELQRFALTEQ